jgi:adenine C2-methylase RlmN of 23S rRNA A2503 and tRNA A37
MKAEFVDFTGRGLFNDAYSYDRPAWIVANAIMNGLIDAGFTSEQAYNWIYSKSYRHFLDGNDHLLEQLVYKLAKKEGKQDDPKAYDYEPEAENARQELNRIKELYSNWGIK